MILNTKKETPALPYDEAIVKRDYTRVFLSCSVPISHLREGDSIWERLLQPFCCSSPWLWFHSLQFLSCHCILNVIQFRTSSIPQQFFFHFTSCKVYTVLDAELCDLNVANNRFGLILSVDLETHWSVPDSQRWLGSIYAVLSWGEIGHSSWGRNTVLFRV